MAIGSSISGGLAYKNNRDAQKDQRKANADLTRRMEVEQANYQAYRPEAQRQRAAALQARLGLLQPANGMLSEMTGGRYALDFGALPKTSPTMPGGRSKPVQSQLGEPAAGGGYDPATLRALQAQGYDIGGAKAAPYRSPADVKPKPKNTAPATLRGGSKK
jgi:hypothetical protein